MILSVPYPQSAGGGGNWYDEPGMQFWGDAYALTGLSNNDPVGSFTDFSGNGRHATASGSARPTFKENQLNGKPIIEFDGVDDFLSLPTFALGSLALTILAVVSIGSSGSVGMMIEQSINYNNNSAWVVYRDTNNKLSLGVHPQSAQNLYAVRENNTTINTLGTYYNVVGTWDQGISGQEATQKVAGSASGSDIRNDNTSGSLGTSLVHYLGARAGSSLFLNMRLAEIAVFNTLLGSSALANWDSYVSSKWGV